MISIGVFSQLYDDVISFSKLIWTWAENSTILCHAWRVDVKRLICMWSSNPIISAKFQWIQTGFQEYTRLIITNWQFSTEPNRSTNKKTSEQIKIWKNRFLTIRGIKLNLNQKQPMHLLKLIKTRLFTMKIFF